MVPERSRLSSHLKRKRGRWGKREGTGNHRPLTVEGFLLPTQNTLALCVRLCLAQTPAIAPIMCQSVYLLHVQISPDYEPFKRKNSVSLICSTSQQLMHVYWTTEWMEEGKEG